MFPMMKVLGAYYRVRKEETERFMQVFILAIFIKIKINKRFRRHGDFTQRHRNIIRNLLTFK